MTVAGQQHDREVRRVLADPLVGLREDLVAGRGQPHRTLAVHTAGGVDVAPGQDELELGPQTHTVVDHGFHVVTR